METNLQNADVSEEKKMKLGVFLFIIFIILVVALITVIYFRNQNKSTSNNQQIQEQNVSIPDAPANMPKLSESDAPPVNLDEMPKILDEEVSATIVDPSTMPKLNEAEPAINDGSSADNASVEMPSLK